MATKRSQCALGKFGFSGGTPTAHVDADTRSKQELARKARKLNPPTPKELADATALRKKQAAMRSQKELDARNAKKQAKLEALAGAAGVNDPQLIKHTIAFLLNGPPFRGCIIENGEEYGSMHMDELRAIGCSFDFPNWVAPTPKILCEVLERELWCPKRVDGPMFCEKQIADIRSIAVAFRELESPALRPSTSGSDSVKGGSSFSVAELHLRRELGIEDDRPEEIAELAALGIGDDEIRALTTAPMFGPRSGPSDAGRILRAIRWPLKVCTADEALQYARDILARGKAKGV